MLNFPNIRALKKQTAPDAVQLSDDDGLNLIAEVYGDKCKERAAFIVRACNERQVHLDALDKICAIAILMNGDDALRIANIATLAKTEGK